MRGSSGKGFFTREEAQRWLDTARGVTPIGSAVSGDKSGEPGLKTVPSSSKRPGLDRTTNLAILNQRDKQNLGLLAAHHATQEHARYDFDSEINQQVQPVIPEIILSEEQLDIMDKVKKGHNVFFTGPAGTGKSVLLRAIIAELGKTKPSEAIAVTATTGIAAIAVGGRTVHSYAGIGQGKEPAKQLLDKVRCLKSATERWESTEVLIIDEVLVSMLEAELFDKLEYIGRQIREDERPFGGIQLILTGDFFQLPPVPRESYKHRSPSQFAFLAKSWHQCVPIPYFLQQVFRQKDSVFIDILSSTRLGRLSQEQTELLQKLARPLVCKGGLEPASLFPIRDEVAKYNARRLSDLPGDEHSYVAIDCAGWSVERKPVPPKAAAQLLAKNSIALEKISLKASLLYLVGAQVMLIKNVKQGVLVNGSMGKVTDFLTVSEARRRCVDAVLVGKGGDIPDPAHQPAGFRPLSNHTFALDEKWPLVRFPCGRELLCSPVDFNLVGFMGNTEARRMQVPLILSWGISMHKSQGQTLNYVRVDFRSIFEHGQAYVALSRATSMEGLQIANFDPASIKAHPEVIRWHEYWENWWKSQKQFAEEMDADEAVRRYWEDSLIQDMSKPLVCGRAVQ